MSESESFDARVRSALELMERAEENPMRRQEIESLVIKRARSAADAGESGLNKQEEQFIGQARGLFAALTSFERARFTKAHRAISDYVASPTEEHRRKAMLDLARIPGENPAQRPPFGWREVLPHARKIASAVRKGDKDAEDKARKDLERFAGMKGLTPRFLTEEEREMPELLAKQIACAAQIRERPKREQPRNPIAACRAALEGTDGGSGKSTAHNPLLRGWEAIRAKEREPEKWSLGKYNDPTEEARFPISIEVAEEVAREDLSLIFAVPKGSQPPWECEPTTYQNPEPNPQEFNARVHQALALMEGAQSRRA